MTTMTLPDIENLSLKVTQEIRVRASLEVTFAALLEQLGPSNERPDGTPMPFKIEAWPGGRWFRDLGDGNGHCWGIAQAIKRPTLLEFSGPLFMSYPVANNVQYRLSEQDGETLIKFCHSGFGLILDDHRKGVTSGWSHMLALARQRAESPGRNPRPKPTTSPRRKSSMSGAEAAATHSIAQSSSPNSKRRPPSRANSSSACPKTNSPGNLTKDP